MVDPPDRIILFDAHPSRGLTVLAGKSTIRAQWVNGDSRSRI